MRKRSFLLVAGACLATLSLATGSALADPAPPQPPFRALQGTGSDTSQEVMNGYANGTSLSTPPYDGVKVGGALAIASWDATGSSTITTFNRPECTNIPRPRGSGAGMNALQGTLPGFPSACANFARSSVNDARAGLTYAPFATDAVTYATFTASNIPPNLSLDDLRTIFRRNIPEGCIFKPRVPQINSGTRSFWNTLVGPFGSCVEQTTIEEHDGAIIGANAVDSPDRIAPYGVGPWVSQATNASVTDRRGLAVIRGINNQSPFEYQGFAGSRQLFNVVRNADVNDLTIRQAFAPNGQICSHPEVLRPFGLQPATNCGAGIPPLP